MSKNTFATRLKKLLDEKQLALVDVARAIDVSAASVHRWTRGGEIEYQNLRVLAKYLDVNWIWLRYGDEAIGELQESMSGTSSAANDRLKYLGEIMANEARMNLAQDMARIVTWEWNVLTDELTASANSEQIFGQPMAQVRAGLLPFDALDLDALTAQFTSTEMAPEWDFSLINPDDHSERWFASRGQLLFDAQKRPLKMVGISIDITERTRMQKSLEKSEYLLRKVIETIPIGLWIADETGHITSGNPEAERIWGGSKLVGLEQYGEYKGRWETSGKEVGAGEWTLARAVQHGEVSRGEIVNIEAFDGAQRTIITSAIPLLDTDDEIIGAIEVNQDITALKTTERSLEATAKQWGSVLKQRLVGIAYYQSGSSSLQVNARFAELLHCSVSDLEGAQLEGLFDDATLQEFNVRMDSVSTAAPIQFMLRGKLQRNTQRATDVLLFFIVDSAENSAFDKLVFAVQSSN